ncbi:ATP-binding cassette domain-containing protein, partial [Falsiroseomonas oryzae]|uniref:ATP-binding cassette domain-containing protein n=1 Tax=Falsiroseomonas oryzae TaxID=2766473 RepID=UPI0022EAA570
MTLRVEVAHRFDGGMRRAARQDGFALDVDFAAPAQGVTALFGPSGSGKSSVLAAVAGLLRPQRGLVALGDAVLLDTVRGVFVPPEQRRCGVVFQDARLFPHMSVATNLRYGLARAPTQDGGPGFEEVVELLGLAPLLQRRPRGLSGGERQRVAL